MLNVTKSGPLPAEATFDPLLTTIAVAYSQGEAADSITDIFPALPVDTPAGKYKVYDRGAFYRDEAGPRPLGGTFPRTGFGMSEQSYSVEEEGLSTPLDSRTLAASADPVALEKGKTELLTHQMRIHHMRAWVRGYFTTGVWTVNRTGVSSAPSTNQFLQFDQAGVDPVKYVRKERLDFHLSTGGMSPNVLVVGADLHRYFCDHDEIRERIPNTQLSVATMQLLAQLFEVDSYVVASAVWNSAQEGASESMQFIANSRSFGLFHRTPNPGDPQAPTAGRMITWDKLVPGGGKMLAVNRWRENPYSENLDVRTAMGPHRVAADLGRFYADAIGASA